MFCTRMKGRLKAMLTGFDSFMDDHIDMALKVTTAMKQLLSSPVTDIITALIPGDLDNILRDKLLSALNKAVEALSIAKHCKQHAALNDKLKCFIEQLQISDPDLQDALLLKLASLLSGHLDGQRLRQSFYDLYTQAKYSTAKV